MPFKQEINRLYYDKKLSIRQVAQAINRSQTYVRARLRDSPRTQHEGTVLRSSEEFSEKIRVTQVGESNTCAKLTESDVIEIRDFYDNAVKAGNKKYETELILSKQFAVGRSTISDIVKHRTWKHI